MSSSYFSKLIKKDGKLVHLKNSSKNLYEEFIKAIPEGTVVEFYSEMQTENGTLAQLAKIHSSIRAIATFTGYSFNELKYLVKEESGICYMQEKENESPKEICKSFGECSSEELNMVIKTIELIGQKVGFLL